MIWSANNFSHFFFSSGFFSLRAYSSSVVQMTQHKWFHDRFLTCKRTRHITSNTTVLFGRHNNHLSALDVMRAIGHTYLREMIFSHNWQISHLHQRLAMIFIQLGLQYIPEINQTTWGSWWWDEELLSWSCSKYGENIHTHGEVKKMEKVAALLYQIKHLAITSSLEQLSPGPDCFSYQ